MKKAKRDDILEEYQRLKVELRFEQVDAVIKNHPQDWRDKLESLGFKWYDDDTNNEQEILEENCATPKNSNQKILMSYLEGDTSFESNLLNLFEKEKNSDDVNFPLFRRYFRTGNERLKNLIISILAKHPTDEGYLWDLVFFHEHRKILKELIDAYHTACKKEENLLNFESLARNFWYHTAPDEYDALYALHCVFEHNRDKLEVIKKLIKERDSAEEDVEF